MIFGKPTEDQIEELKNILLDKGLTEDQIAKGMEKLSKIDQKHDDKGTKRKRSSTLEPMKT